MGVAKRRAIAAKDGGQRRRVGRCWLLGPLVCRARCVATGKHGITGSDPLEWDGDLQAYEVEPDGARVTEVFGRERQPDLVCRARESLVGHFVERAGRPV